MSWTEDGNITTTWYEDNISTEWGYLFNQITENFNMVEFKFNEMGSGTTLSEDAYISTTWSED